MRYAIISDIHEDIVRLEHVISSAEKLGTDRFICLGDITGYSDLHHSHIDTKDAEACVDLIRSVCDVIVAGNHDLNTVDKLPEYLQRHENANSFLPKETWTYEGEIHAVLSPRNYNFLNSLPEYAVVDDGKNKILFTHYLYPDITGSTIMIPELRKELKPHFNFMENKDCRLSFAGHTHINGFAVSDGRFIQFKEFGFRKISKKKQIVFCPAVVKDGERSGYILFDSDTNELAVIKIDTYT